MGDIDVALIILNLCSDLWLSGHLLALATLSPGNNTGTYCIGGWVGLSAGLRVLEWRKFV